MTETELRFYALFNLRLELAGILTPEGILSEANDRSLALVGATREEVIGRPFWETPWWSHDPALAERLRGAVEAAAAGEAVRFDAVHIAKDGEERIVDFSLTPVVDDGRIAFLLAESIDKTDQQRDRRRADLSEQRFAGVVTSAMDAIVSVDAEGRVVLFNEAAERMFECSAAEATGAPLDRFLPESERDRHRSDLARFASSGATSRRMGSLGRVVGVRANGEEFPIEASISRTEAADPSEVLMTAILRDVSERDAAQERLRASEARAQAAENLASVGTLAAGLAHEIGTPMGVVRGHAELLEDKVSDDKSRWRVQTIVEQIDRISNIMHSLLNLTRRERPEHARVSLSDLAETALGFLEERLRRRGISVECDFRARDATLYGDAEKLQQLLLNLYMNASDAMEHGGTLGVRVERLPDEHLQLEVSDTGEGIAPELLARIFDPFFTSKEAGRGSGLGLVVARSIAIDHGGSIDVESELGEGTTFRIRLPTDRDRSEGGDQ